MNETITSREELLLAKIAGHDVDLRTMTPPVASNLSEKFMLEIADRLDGMDGGSGEKFETVAEIAVGQMQDNSGLYIYTATDAEQPEITSGETYYFNTADNPGVASGESELWIYFNVNDPEEFAPKDPDMVAAAYGYDNGTVTIGANQDLSNTTVRILKKVSAPSGGGKFVVTVDEDKNVEGLYNADKTIAECIAAYEAGQNVVCLFEKNEVPLFVIEDGTIAFSKTALLGGTIASVMVQGMPEDGADTWDVVTEQKSIPDNLKPTKEFDFIAAPDGQGGKTITPASGVTYSAVFDAWEHDAEVIFKISEGNDVTKFHVKSHVGSASPKYFDCTELAYLGENGWAGVFLTFDANNTATMRIQPLAVRS